MEKLCQFDIVFFSKNKGLNVIKHIEQALVFQADGVGEAKSIFCGLLFFDILWHKNLTDLAL